MNADSRTEERGFGYPTDEIDYREASYIVSAKEDRVSSAKTNLINHQKELSPMAPKRRPCYGFASKYWLLELVSLLFSAGLFAAIIGVLNKFDGQSIPKWRYNITLGALVSLLAILATFTLIVPLASGLGQLKWIWFHHERPISDFQIIEKASHGPLGSILLLFKRKGG
jgi:Protein of unknown function (DUF3176)